MSSGTHPTASVSTRTDIQEHVLIGALVVIEDGAMIGDVSAIGAHAFIGKDVRIGEGCEVGACSILGRGLTVESGVIIDEGVISHGRVAIEKGVHVGPGAILVGGQEETLRIGAGATVYAGEIVTEDVPPAVIQQVIE